MNPNCMRYNFSDKEKEAKKKIEALGLKYQGGYFGTVVIDGQTIIVDFSSVYEENYAQHVMRTVFLYGKAVVRNQVDAIKSSIYNLYNNL